MREAAAQRLLAGRVEPPLVEPLEGEERRRPRPAPSGHGQAAAAAAEPAQPGGLGRVLARPRAGARLDERPRPVGELDPPRVVDVPARDPLGARERLPERGGGGLRRPSQPAVGAQRVEQAAAGRLDEVEHVLEAVVAAVVGIGDVEVRRAGGGRVELAQQVQLARARRRAGPPRRSRRLRRSAARIRS